MLPLSNHAVSIMPKSAPRHSELDAFGKLIRGTVVGRLDRLFIIDTDDGECRARRAFSCLVVPEVDDRVLIARDDQEAHVLAVLDRNSGDATLHTEGDLRLAPKGTIELSSEELTIHAPEFALQSRKGRVTFEDLSYVGGKVEATLGTVRMVAASAETLVDRLTQRAKTILRFADESETVRAGALDYSAEKTARVHGHDTVVTAEQLVKVDGGQIHLG